MRTAGIVTSIFLLVAVVFGQAKILHSPPGEVYADSPINIEAIIEGNTSGIERVRLFYRGALQASYIELEMVEYMGIFTGNIPARSVTENGVEYLIFAEFSNGSIAAYPEVDPYNVPMFLSVKRKIKYESEWGTETISGIQEGISANVIILSPEEGEIVPSEEVIIAVSLFNIPDVDLNSISLKLDGISITEDAEITEDLITVSPKDLKPGVHTISLNMADKQDNPYSTQIWHFTVVRTVAMAKKVFDYSGRISAEASSEVVRGEDQSIQQIRANARGSYDWLRFDARAFLSSKEDPNRQPRNRLTAGLRTSFLDLRFGDINPQFSDFGLNGKRVRGLEVHLKLKYFNMHFVSGQTDRAIEGGVSIDTLSDKSLQHNRSGYTFARDLVGIRPYFGTGRHFQFGLSLLKVRDDTLSVKREIGGITENGVPIVLGGVKPKDNIVLGTDLILSLYNRRIVWETDAAISMSNRDISDGPLTLKDLDTFAPGDTLENDTLSLGDFNIPLSAIPFDPADFADFFIINTNLKPLIPIVPDTSGAVGMKEILSMPSTAFKTSLTLNYYNNYIILTYRRVGAEFSSLGNPFFRSDIQGFSLSDKIRLFKNKLFLNLLYDQTKNNLGDDKNSTTLTSSFTAGFSLYPGEGLPTINLSTRHYSRGNDLDEIDTLALRDYRNDDLTMTQNISISHLVELADIRNNISITYVNSDKKDRIKDRSELFTYTSSEMTTSMIRVGVQSTFQFPLKTNVSLSTNKSKSGISDKPYEFIALGLQGEYGFLDGDLQTLAGYRITNGSGLAEFTQNNIYVGGFYKFLKIHQVRGRFNYTRLNDRISKEKFNDYSFLLTYSLMF